MYTFDSPPKLKQTTKFLYLFSRLNSSTRAQCSICLMWVAKDLNVKSGFTVLTTQIASFLWLPCLNMIKFFQKTPVSIECRYSKYIKTVKEVFSKSSENGIVLPNLCYLSQRQPYQHGPLEFKIHIVQLDIYQIFEKSSSILN